MEASGSSPERARAVRLPLDPFVGTVLLGPPFAFFGAGFPASCGNLAVPIPAGASWIEASVRLQVCGSEPFVTPLTDAISRTIP